MDEAHLLGFFFLFFSLGNWMTTGTVSLGIQDNWPFSPTHLWYKSRLLEEFGGVFLWPSPKTRALS